MTEVSSRPKKTLFFTCQPVYVPGAPATGGGYRAYAIARALRDRGHEVVFSEPEGAPGDGRNIPEIISSVRPDVVIFGNWGLVDRSPECDLPTVVDINGSLILENHFRRGSSLFGDMLGKIRALEKVDLVLAGSFRQKMFLSSWCLMAGMRPESIRIEVMPFSLPPVLPTPAPPEEPVFVMAGYRWPWLDGRKAVEAVSRELDRLQRGVLKIFTSSPPFFDIIPGEDSRGDSEGSLDVARLPRVELHGPVPFDELTGILSRSTVGLDIWEESMERTLAVSSRAVAYLWCGLPVMTNEGAGLAGPIEEYGAGWTVAPHDVGAIARLVREIVLNPGALEEPRAGAARLVRDRFTWDRTIGVLDEFCRSAARNRSASPFLELMDRRDERIERLAGEARLMSDVHRRPRGLEVMFPPDRIGRRVRRWGYRIPVLAYLLALGCFGDFLIGLRERWGVK